MADDAALRAAGQHDVPVLRAVPAHDGRAATSPSVSSRKGSRATRSTRRVARDPRHRQAGRSSAKRKPHQLSGGQRQRVALARALVKRPKLLLLDEPLGALDRKLREHTQFELLNIQEQLGVTFVVVTHDQEEAMTLASRIGVMNHGEIVQVGTPRQIYEFPATRFVADFIGSVNLFEGQLTEDEPDHVRVAVRGAAAHRSTSIMASARRRLRAVLGGRAAGEDRARTRERPPAPTTGRTARFATSPTWATCRCSWCKLDSGRRRARHAGEPHAQARGAVRLGRGGLPVLGRLQPRGMAEPHERIDGSRWRPASSAQATPGRADAPGTAWQWFHAEPGALVGLRARSLDRQAAGHRGADALAAAVLPGAVPDRVRRSPSRKSVLAMPPYDAAVRAGRTTRCCSCGCTWRTTTILFTDSLYVELVPVLAQGRRGLDVLLPAARLSDGATALRARRRPGATCC